jgi:SAM-dependent methyltransferase
MKCKICQNEKGNTAFELKEMMYGFGDTFPYFQCSSCNCIQIVSPPENMIKYYPGDYYSYSTEMMVKRLNFFRRLQCRSIIRGEKSLFSKIITYKYKSPAYYQTLKNLKLFDLSSSVLDAGSGSGELLKCFYEAGYKNLTGIDPYIEKDLVYNDCIRIEKKELFDVSGKFDAIMLNHSLEHMEHQPEVIKKLYSILTKEGRLLIRIPIVSKPLMEEYGLNVVSLDPPRHFYIHSFKSISLLLEKAGFITENVIYDAYEFSCWGSEQYKNGISLHNHPESYLVKKTFSNEQMAGWRIRIRELNKRGESDNLAIYLKK